MANVAVWEVSGSSPERLKIASVDFEVQLEDWIAQDPDLVEFGLTIIGRQVPVTAGFIDVLAIDPQGRWFVIEVKRGRIDRQTLAQVLDYAAALDDMEEVELRETLRPHLQQRNQDLDELLRRADALDALQPGHRDLVLVVVGTSQSPGLDRIVRFLSDRYDVPIMTKFFRVFETSGGARLLVREVTEGEGFAASPASARVPDLSSVRRLAEEAGLEDVFDVLVEAGRRHGLGERLWKRSVMLTPPTDGRRCLLTIWASPVPGGLRMYVQAPVFAEFFGVPEEQIIEVLGGTGYRVVDLEAARNFSQKLDWLFQEGSGGAKRTR